MTEFNIKDTLRVSDSKIKGFVIMQDQDGKTIFAKSNMIVEAGRNFIMDLVYNQVATAVMDTRSFSHIEFGSGNGITTPDHTELETPITAITDIDITSDTDLVWSEVITTYSTGTSLPATAVIGELFIFNNDDEGFDPASPITYDLYTATATDTWNAGVPLTDALTLPTITTEPHGTYIFATNNNKLYYVSYILEILPTSVGLGLKIVINVTGNAGVLTSGTELGILLSDDTLFSRIVFDAIPLAANFSYKLTYYIYF